MAPPSLNKAPIVVCTNDDFLAPHTRQVIKTQIQYTQAHILELETEIQRVHDLEEQLARSKSVLSALETMIAPHKRLPDEILREIFSHFPTEGHPLRIPRFSVIEGPWALRQVCSRWRKIALDCRFLWNAIYIDSKLPGKPAVGVTNTKTLDHTFRRSWTQKLKCARKILPPTGCINLSFRLNGQLVAPLASEALQSLILPNAERIQSLILDTCATGLRFFLRIPTTARFSCLKSLSVLDNEGLRDGHDHLSWNRVELNNSGILTLTSHVERLSIQSASVLSLMDEDTALPLWKLTELDLDFQSNILIAWTTIIFPTLRLCTNLIGCRIRGVAADTTDPNPLPVVLPKLQRLDLKVAEWPEDDEDVSIYVILDLLELPSLVSLTICEPFAGSCPLRRLVDFIRRSGCSESLTTLCNFQSHLYDPAEAERYGDDIITVGQFSYRDLEQLAILIPKVEDLTLALHISSDRLEPLAEAGHLPNLRRLSVWDQIFSLDRESEPCLKSVFREIKRSGKWRQLEEVDMHTMKDLACEEGFTYKRDLEDDNDVTFTIFSPEQ